jgi:nitrous oxide reductase accessory protein NosL
LTARSPASPAAALQGLDAAGQFRIGAEDRCPVCAMPVSDHAKFASAIELADGRTFYFCGTGCMIRTWMHPEAYLHAARTDLKRAVTRDYFAGQPLDAGEAVFVAGSDVVGPMGPALVPLRNDADVRTFNERHGGKTTFRLADMDDARWEATTGRKALPAPVAP